MEAPNRLHAPDASETLELPANTALIPAHVSAGSFVCPSDVRDVRYVPGRSETFEHRTSCASAGSSPPNTAMYITDHNFLYARSL
jgi:hypothetical protein